MLTETTTSVNNFVCLCVLYVCTCSENDPSRATSGSVLMCQNWDLTVLQKRYRSEAIQEVFMKSAASLRYDRERKRFVVVEEQKHPVYRLVGRRVACCGVWCSVVQCVF